MIIGGRNNIDIEQLFSSTTYKTNSFDRCIYCHKDVENDYYRYNGEFIGQPYRCNCENAKKELEAKESLFKTLMELQKSVDVEKINSETKEAIEKRIDKAFKENKPHLIKNLL